MRSRYLLIASMLLLAAASPTFAQTSELTGFVDASWVYNTADLNGEFSLNEVELNFLHQVSPRTLMRADLEWVRAGEEFAAQVEQAFISYTVANDWTFTFGKFNAPIGFEMNDPPDMHQVSHSLVYDHGSPTNLTGFSLGRELGRGFEVLAYGCNGWDRNTKVAGAMTWGGRLGFERNGFVWGLSGIGGKEESDGATFTRTVVDLDTSYESGPWLLGAEYNRGEVTHASGAEQSWSGFLVVARRSLNDWMGLTLRFDHFDDTDGYAFAAVDGRFQRRQSLTVAPTFDLDEGLVAILELRVDMSDRNAFVDREGMPTDSSTTIAFGMTYAF